MKNKENILTPKTINGKKPEFVFWFLLGILTVTTGANIYFFYEKNKPIEIKREIVTEEKGLFFANQQRAIVKNENLNYPEIKATAALILDTTSKQVLLAKNADELLYPASTTKIMTALTAREFYHLEDEIAITQIDLSDGNPLALKVNDKIHIDTLLKTLLIESNNQAASILANHYPGGAIAFVTRMNQKAEALTLKKTHFVNPQGYDDPEQKSTAFDLTIAALELLRDDYLKAIVAQPTLTINDVNNRTFNLTSTNQLLKRNDLGWQVLGIKTGTTNLAKEVLISLIKKDRQEFLVVVLGAQNRYNETIKLTNFVWDKYSWTEAELWQNNNQPLI